MKEELQGELTEKFKEVEKLRNDSAKQEKEFQEKIHSLEKSTREQISLLRNENEELKLKSEEDQKNLKFLATLQEDRKRLLQQIEDLQSENEKVKKDVKKVRKVALFCNGNVG